MRLRLFRNATQRLLYAGRELLLDPFFAPKHSRPSFEIRSMELEIRSRALETEAGSWKPYL